jgi:hypothetical protein
MQLLAPGTSHSAAAPTMNHLFPLFLPVMISGAFLPDTSSQFWEIWLVGTHDAYDGHS